MSVKYEESEDDSFTTIPPQDPSSPNLNDENENENENDDPQLPTPPSSPIKQPSSKKRRLTGEPVDHISKVKSEYHLTAATTTTATTDTEAPTKKASTPSKRGRPAGVSSAFTPEQDAYLIHLRQKSSKGEDIWIKFEKKFHSGKNAKALENRWFAIKDSVLLSGDEDKLLMETIEEVIGDIAASIVEKFKGKSGKKVTKAYVQKKMKEGKGKTKKE
ncbi:hypothetical protein TWF106_007062 [Orbilia oligospora]|uniref:Uncharacterized protein n=1 Tax=Orbilia oligospora TaxID=2813651 RepID=A0A7C8URB2_ORBOL|nr:hypothetical protein TWF106_007062 [Orbilia oligospora]